MRRRPASGPARLALAVGALAVVAGLAGCSDRCTTCGRRPEGPALLIGFTSSRPPAINFGTDIWFYDAGTQQPAWLPANVNSAYDEGPLGLSADGHWMVFRSSRVLTGTLATIFLDDLRTGVIRALETSDYYQPQNPALSGDGRLVAFQHQVGAGFLDLAIAMKDVVADTVVNLPTLHLEGAGDFDPALSGDGGLIAFTSNRTGSFDVLLYSVPGDSLVPLPGLNTPSSETGASISADGRYIAFHSNRPGGNGLFDVYVYDRSTAALLAMPGANTPLSELNPALSPDGGWVAFTSENDGAGDIRLYDLVAKRLADVPGLNDSYYPDRFPSVANRP